MQHRLEAVNLAARLPRAVRDAALELRLEVQSLQVEEEPVAGRT
jgi:hypothetical protein